MVGIKAANYFGKFAVRRFNIGEASTRPPKAVALLFHATANIDTRIDEKQTVSATNSGAFERAHDRCMPGPFLHRRANGAGPLRDRQGPAR